MDNGVERPIFWPSILGPSFLAFVRAARLVNSGSREREADEQAGEGRRAVFFFFF